jgi:branched-chain amino acid transport system ATP-binding protein
MILEAVNISVNYGKVAALRDASFGIENGEIIAMIGSNGAGKSTALKAMTGMLGDFGGQLTHGNIFLEGQNINHLRTDELAHKGLGIVPEGRRVFQNMTVKENLIMGAFLSKNQRQIAVDIDRILNLFPQLQNRINHKAKVLSGGEQQMLALGRALMLNPKILLADEPSVGLSPNYIELIFQKFLEINQHGISLIIVEQNAQMALAICHRAYVFETGKIVLSGTKNDLINDIKVKQSYLGY